MRLVVVTEQRFVRDPAGRFWSETGAGYEFWIRYRVAFDQICIAARVRQSTIRDKVSVRVDGADVQVFILPYYVGPVGFLRRSLAVMSTIRRLVGDGDAVLLRVPSPLGILLAFDLRRRGLPFALEIVGDPYDVLSVLPANRLFRSLLRRPAVAALKWQAKNAVGVSYVTAHALQKRYPAAASALRATYSSIELHDEAFAESPRRKSDFCSPFAIISIGSLEQTYKGIDVLIDALGELKHLGVTFTWTHIGDGRWRRQLEERAGRLGIRDRVQFTGQLAPGEAVRRHLRISDLFVLPSRTEGLPRALIEAMALALPAIASSVGGVPEILGAPYLVEPGDQTGLTRRMFSLLLDPAGLARSSAQNWERARDFHADILSTHRTSFYQGLRLRFGRERR